jgi:site-specific DNA recombinase
LNRAHRREFLLSGLLTCSCCGGGYTIVAQNRYGCATRRAKGICANARTIRRQHIEVRVLEALRDRLLTPEMAKEFVEAFTEELAKLEHNDAGNRSRLQRGINDVTRRLEGVLHAVEKGAWHESLKGKRPVCAVV